MAILAAIPRSALAIRQQRSHGPRVKHQCTPEGLPHEGGATPRLFDKQGHLCATGKQSAAENSIVLIAHRQLVSTDLNLLVLLSALLCHVPERCCLFCLFAS